MNLNIEVVSKNDKSQMTLTKDFCFELSQPTPSYATIANEEIFCSEVKQVAIFHLNSKWQIRKRHETHFHSWLAESPKFIDSEFHLKLGDFAEHKTAEPVWLKDLLSDWLKQNSKNHNFKVRLRPHSRESGRTVSKMLCFTSDTVATGASPAKEKCLHS